MGLAKNNQTTQLMQMFGRKGSQDEAQRDPQGTGDLQI
jgi:hypothetical protein